jgi:hypothetical protein
MWHDSYVLVLLAIAALAVLYCVVMVSQGRGGQLTEFAPDVPPLDLPEPGQLTAVDVMALQLPVSLVGYNTQSVDETLQRAATALGERDTHIAVLEQRLAELLAGRVQARQESFARPNWAPPPSEHAELLDSAPEKASGDLAAAPPWHGPAGDEKTVRPVDGEASPRTAGASQETGVNGAGVPSGERPAPAEVAGVPAGERSAPTGVDGSPGGRTGSAEVGGPRGERSAPAEVDGVPAGEGSASRET